MPRRARTPKALQPGTPLADNPVPGQTYGAETAQKNAMDAVPMAPSPLPAPGSVPLVRPSERPNEPFTHGLPVGPGAGPEALEGAPTQSMADQLKMLAAGPDGSDNIGHLAALADTLGL